MRRARVAEQFHSRSVVQPFQHERPGLAMSCPQPCELCTGFASNELDNWSVALPPERGLVDVLDQ